MNMSVFQAERVELNSGIVVLLLQRQIKFQKSLCLSVISTKYNSQQKFIECNPAGYKHLTQIQINRTTNKKPLAPTVQKLRMIHSKLNGDRLTTENVLQQINQSKVVRLPKTSADFTRCKLTKDALH